MCNGRSGLIRGPSWTTLPPEHADALRELRNHRLQGRYEQVAFTVDGSALKPLMKVVEEMIQVAETYSGHAVRRLDEQIGGSTV